MSQVADPLEPATSRVRPLLRREYDQLVAIGAFEGEPIELLQGALVDRYSGAIRPLRRREYDLMVELGMLEGEPVELLQGELVLMSPQSSAHAWVIRTSNKILTDQVGDRAWVQAQCPLALSEDDEPEPDVAIVPLGEYRFTHPTTALLVVEVSVSSLGRDLRSKAIVYARAGIPEFWIIDVRSQVVHVHREPISGSYTRVTKVARGDVLDVLVLPGIRVATDDILP